LRALGSPWLTPLPQAGEGGSTPTPRAASGHGGEAFGSWILTVLANLAERKLPELAQIAIKSAL